MGRHLTLFSISNCLPLPIFMLASQFAAILLGKLFLGPGTQHPSLKIALRGIFQLGSAFHLFQHIKLPISTNFHAGITICSNIIRKPFFGAWGQVPQPKNSTWGHFSAGVCILSFSAPKIIPVTEVSCWYPIFHNIFANSLDYTKILLLRNIMTAPRRITSAL